MAEKEAIIFILDLGSTMSRTHNGRSESDLDWSMRFVWDKMTDIVAANRKTLCVGVVGLRTDGTSNKLQADEGYENISVLQDLGPMTMSSLKTLQASIKPSKTCAGDAVSAIVVAVDMIDSFTKKLKWIRKIYLITDGQGALDADDVEPISKKMNQSNIGLTVLGVDFDDAEYGFKEEDKTPTKAETEHVLTSLVERCENGTLATVADAIDRLDTPTVKSVKPYKTYDGSLTLGDPEKFPSAMNINVERYFKTHLARPLGASTVVVKPENIGGETQSTQTADEAMEGTDFSAVKQARSYKVNDPDAPGGKRDVEFESLAKGYEYGRTAVPISESEHNYEPFLNLGEACVTYARKFDEESELALSSLVWALLEVESYAVARIVLKDGKDPLLVLLVPHVDTDMECLYDVPLPFAEDIRTYQFPPLDRVVTVSGQTLSKHRLLPSEDLDEAMSDYVDAMDLSRYGIDDDGEPAEYAPFDDSYNPAIHRVNHAVKARAVHATGPVPPTPAVLLRFSSPPEDLIQKVQNRIDTLIQVAEVKKEALRNAAKQMGQIIQTLVTDSFGDSKYAQAIECCGVMREELNNLDEPRIYNTFVRDLKMKVLSGTLGGDRRDFWFNIRSSRLGLIDKMLSELSEVSTEEAAEFYNPR
ncbi:ATP-dependent DNA helicase 2 subunit 2 [Geosmithia morbida]|uniref:ATP-dependent DNA helicase II subunit 2 n=1 Tax=Geosmithia morbida TaxID=1094350 RepID=A0A9P4YT49_9HYPO|nr:ATP-dependent DNA helicase 2 subunit 2 [Geosmithia morbida]KAF4121181.1 ATP-dependent DNA helicase 2 subunit 2 [Geosmithia morbida]